MTGGPGEKGARRPYQHTRSSDSVLSELHSDRFIDRAPAEVVATLLDEGRWLCSERSMYRILGAEGEVVERRDQSWHPKFEMPQLRATGPNQVWSWDITMLKGPMKWVYYHLYVMLDSENRNTQSAKRLSF